MILMQQPQPAFNQPVMQQQDAPPQAPLLNPIELDEGDDDDEDEDDGQ